MFVVILYVTWQLSSPNPSNWPPWWVYGQTPEEAPTLSLGLGLSVANCNPLDNFSSMELKTKKTILEKMVDPISTTAAVISIAMFGVSEGLGIYNGSGTCASCIQLAYSGFLLLKQVLMPLPSRVAEGNPCPDGDPTVMSETSHNPQPPMTTHELSSAIPTTPQSKKPLTSVWGVI